MENVAGSLIESARAQASLSARAVARRAGLATTTITRAEAGEVDVGVGTLQRAMMACGFGVEITPFRIPQVTDVGDSAGDNTADWTLLRVAVDFATTHPEYAEATCLAPPRTMSQRAANLLAAVAEILAGRHGFIAPAWTSGIKPLDEPWEASGTPAMKATNRAAAPNEFRSRNIWMRADGIFR